MKIIKWIFILTFVLSMMGCQDEPIIDDPLDCGENQEEVDGKCVIIDQDLEDIKNALIETNDLTNYQIDVLIEYSEATIEYAYEMTLSFDHQIARFEMGEDDVVYYEITSDQINQYTKQGNTYALETVDQVNGYDFYQNLDPKWFSKIDDAYLLGSQYLENITDDIKTYFPEGSANNFKISLADGVINYFMFDILVDEETTYHLTFTFSMIDQVSLELPTV
jgi:hypothetical protein